MKKIIAAVFGLVVIFLVILGVNTAMFTSKQDAVGSIQTIDVDKNAVLERLSQALQIPTVSHQDRAKIDTARYLEFHTFLEKNYPLVHQKLERRVINNYSLLYKWQGNDPGLKPVVFMAHIDVVPIEPGTDSKWTYGAFSGKVADGFVWGRGAIDMKSTLISEIEAVEELLKQDYVPKRTIYLAFGHDEEIGGENGAKKIANFLQKHNVQIDFTVDEGMLILNEKLSPAKRPTAIIGLAEKGYITLKLTAHAKGGHSSMPPSKTTIGILANAIVRMEQNQMPANFAGPVEQLFEYLGPEMPLIQKVLFANRWLFKSVIVSQLEKIGSMNAMLRTTTAPTMLSGGVKENVLPSQAYVLINFRILPGNTPDDVVAHAKKVIADSAVEVSIYRGRRFSPSPVSATDNGGFKAIKQTVREIFKDTLVAPGLVIAGTDTKHFTGISDNNYRFFPLIVGPADLKRIHGTNERIAVDNYVKMIQFYTRLIQNISDSQSL